MLSAKQKRYLRGLAHDRKVIVQMGTAGLTGAVLAEIEVALEVHELLKVRVIANDRDDRKKMIAEICEKYQAVMIQRVGHVATIYRRNEAEPKIVLP